MKRVLILIKGLGRGGAELLLARSVPYLNHARFEYDFAYLLPWKDALAAEISAAGFPVHCLGAHAFQWTRRLRKVVRDRDIDLVHVHSPYAAIGARVLLPKTKIVYTEHNVWSRYQRLTYWSNLLTYARNDHVFTVSEEARRSVRYPKLLRRRRMPAVETLYHGLAPGTTESRVSPDGVRAELGVPEEAPVIGNVANFKGHKGHRYLLEAAALVRHKVPETRVILVGLGPEERSIKRLCADMGLNGAVVFAGYREDALRVAATFDVFAMASLQEGLPIALIEAMALGKPVVATAVGGVPEVITHGVDGLLVPPARPDALAEAIVELLQDPALRRRLGNAARERARVFDIRNAVTRAEAVYEELLR